MANYLHDNNDLLFQLKHLDMDRFIRLREDDFAEKQFYAHAPSDVDDAKDSYFKLLELVGQLCADYLAPRAAEIDEEGVKLVDGQVQYARGTTEVLDLFAKADLMGFCLPRRYGGLNCPSTILTAAAEMISRADASFLNFGLQQDIGETLNKFGSEDQKARVLPLLASGEAGSSMILTEPDAGSDLQAVTLKAVQAADGRWYLNGVKRFITNGCGRFGLVLARSEDGSKGAGGLSFFLYERDQRMVIRRLENKLGIHGSPTCELQFNDAPAELVGERRRGLIRYTMWLMNSARLGIAAQAMGIAEAAYREARKYASERVQFGSPVIVLPPVYELLTEMKIAIEAGRSLLYETARLVDLKEGLERVVALHPERSHDFNLELKKYSRLAALYTPLVKAFNTEMANQVAYQAIQIHGGPGYMKEFPVERHYRDARITNIYEGTTQLQVVAAIGGINSGVAQSALDDYESEDFSHAPALLERTKVNRNRFEQALVHIKAVRDETIASYHARRLVEMCTDLIQSYLLLRDAKYQPRKLKLAELFIDRVTVRIRAQADFILESENTLIRHYQDIIDSAPVNSGSS